MARVIVVDREHERVKILKVCLAGMGHSLIHTVEPDAAIEALSKSKPLPDLLVVGEGLDRGEIKELLGVADKISPKPALLRILGAAAGGDPDYVLREAEDFDDCLLCPLNINALTNTFATLLSRERAETAGLITFDGMIGSSPEIQAAFRQMLSAAANDEPVLLIGEPGTGKHTAGLRIHEASSRKKKPFRHVRCAGHSDESFAAELFGENEMALPAPPAEPARQNEYLQGGTLYLEGVETLSLRTQVKVLQMIEGRQPSAQSGLRLGCMNVRILTATTHHLSALVESGRFIAELYFRLALNLIELPALRSRPGDIPQIVHRILAEDELQISTDAMDILMNHAWPGNLDELKTVLSRAGRWCENRRITRTDLPPEMVCRALRSGLRQLYTPTVVRPPVSIEPKRST